MQTSAHTWCEQNDGGDDQRADDQDDQQSDGDSLPVPLWRATANQLLSNTQKQTCKRLKVKFVQFFFVGFMSKYVISTRTLLFIDYYKNAIHGFVFH